jgi:hypothetical protein
MVTRPRFGVQSLHTYEHKRAVSTVVRRAVGLTIQFGEFCDQVLVSNAKDLAKAGCDGAGPLCCASYGNESKRLLSQAGDALSSRRRRLSDESLFERAIEAVVVAAY